MTSNVGGAVKQKYVVDFQKVHTDKTVVMLRKLIKLSTSLVVKGVVGT